MDLTKTLEGIGTNIINFGKDIGRKAIPYVTAATLALASMGHAKEIVCTNFLEYSKPYETKDIKVEFIEKYDTIDDNYCHLELSISNKKTGVVTNYIKYTFEKDKSFPNPSEISNINYISIPDGRSNNDISLSDIIDMEGFSKGIDVNREFIKGLSLIKKNFIILNSQQKGKQIQKGLM